MLMLPKLANASAFHHFFSPSNTVVPAKKIIVAGMNLRYLISVIYKKQIAINTICLITIRFVNATDVSQ